MSNTDPVRIGFIGAGQHARSMLYPSLHFVPNVKLTAIATRTPETALKASEDFGVRCHVGHEALLADVEVEAVIISVPGSQSAELSAVALSAGKHVMCETPGLTSDEDADLVGKAESGSGKLYQVAFCLRYAPIYRKLKTLLEEWRAEGDEGFCIDIRYYEWIHHFYNLAIYLAGDVTELRAWQQGGSRRIVLTYANGDLGTIRSTAFHNHAIPYEEVEVTARDGMLRAVDRSELRRYRHSDAISTREMTFDTAGGSVWRYSTSVAYNRLNTLYASGYAAEIEDFADCIRSGRPVLSGLDDTQKTEAIRRAVEASVKEERSIGIGTV